MPPNPRPELPTGEQWAIAHGSQQVVVTEMGATLRHYSLAGIPVVDGFGDTEWAHAGRGQVLAPWPNRLGDGRYEFGGQVAEAPLDEPARRNAIHGLVRWLPWRLVSRAQNVLLTECVLHATPGYPFSVALTLEHRLGRDGLTVTAAATNIGGGPAPFGIGFHPYLVVGPAPVDAWRLRLPASSWLPTDERGLPTGRRDTVAGTDLDFREGRLIGPLQLDTAYADLERDRDGLARVSLTGPRGDRSAELWVDGEYRYLMCFTGDTLAAGERRRSVAVEPMTCPPDALRSGTDLKVLEPGASWEGRWGIRPG